MRQMVNVDIVNAVYCKVENRPGNLSRIGRALGEQKVNIDAISADTLGGTGVVRILTHKPNEAVNALRNVGIEAYESPTVVANIPNQSGKLGQALGDVAASGINVEGVITTPDGRVALRTSDPERTAQILRKL